MRFIDYIKKYVLKIKLYFQFHKFLKSQMILESTTKPVEEKLLLKFNANNFKYLEWADFGNMKLPIYYFIKDGKKYHYLHWFDKTTNIGGVNQRMVMVDKSITTLN